MATFDLYSPRGGETASTIDNATAADVARSAEALRANMPAWSAAPLGHRIAVLRRWQEALVEHQEAIVSALAEDTGRIALSAVEFAGVLARIDYWCSHAPTVFAESSSGTSETAPGVTYQHQRVPLGLVGVISPWNFPLLLTMTDALPALVAGCAVLAKPSEITSRFVAPLKASLDACPELADVFDLVTGLGTTGAAVINQADAVCFTGSVATGRKVGAQAGERLIPAFLELGGKDPLLVLADADLDMAVDAALRSSVISTGQACQSIERIYVHTSLFDEFVEKVVAQAKTVETNRAGEAAGVLGPFIDRRQADKVEMQVRKALADGAVQHCGEFERNEGGAWCTPIVLTNVNHDMDICREETFGPVLPIMSFDDDEQAIAQANDTSFGLSAAVIGEPAHALAVARRIRAGAVSVNDGGLTTQVADVEKESFGDSGVGRSRMGPAGLRRFLRVQALLIQNGPVLPISAYSPPKK